MTDQEFLELKTEVERLEALHKASRDDHNMDIDERRAIADAYTPVSVKVVVTPG